MTITLSNLISQARKRKKLTLKKLALKIKREDGKSISSQYLQDIEDGKRITCSSHLLNELAKTLDLNDDYLHYVIGKFSPDDRKEILCEEDFIAAMQAFRAEHAIAIKNQTLIL